MPVSGSATGSGQRSGSSPTPSRARDAGPFPAIIEVERTVSNQALIGFRGNRYSVPPRHAGEVVTVRHKLGATTVDISTGSGALLAHHVRQPDGAGAVVRTDEHVTALTKVWYWRTSPTANRVGAGLAGHAATRR
jgi:hypothetical protein